MAGCGCTETDLFMLKKIILISVATLAAIVLLGYLNRGWIFESLAAAYLQPEIDFDSSNAPAAPDYRLQESWAARPDIVDLADERPEGDTTSTPQHPVSVFFVHPTTYISKTSWNQPPDDSRANWIIDHRVLRYQASVFNACCNVYAPRYRQATIFSFSDRTGNGEAALNFAYQDVLAAFEQFLVELPENQPFILAGHSQGSFHAARLLREQIANSKLRRRLVAAYLVGFSISEEDLGGISVCEDQLQTGCAVGWNTVDGSSPGLFPDQPLICVNPLNWSAAGTHAAHEMNLGAVGFPRWGPGKTSEPETLALVPAVADAQCVNDSLRVTELRSAEFPSRMSRNSLHLYDYGLFYLNVRDNALARVNAFLSAANNAAAGGS